VPVALALPLANANVIEGVIELDPDHARKLLQQERQRIQRELDELRAEKGGEGELSTVDQHPADAGTELFEDERVQSMIERLERELETVDRAMKRLEDGSYGRSVESGKPIPDARLEAVPHAERTVEEQARLEAEDRNAS
jgi:DnaK suppressor protein